MLNRECYLVYYRHNGALRRLKKVDNIQIYYISEKSKYVTIYFDKKDEKQVINTIRKIRGIRHLEPSLLDKPDIHIPL